MKQMSQSKTLSQKKTRLTTSSKYNNRRRLVIEKTDKVQTEKTIDQQKEIRNQLVTTPQVSSSKLPRIFVS